MQIIVIIALIFISTPAFAQTFPSGSDSVEINLDALKPMDETYEPPPMFEAPLTGIETEALSEPQKPKDIATKPLIQKPEYFDPPPYPPKRPAKLSVSQEFLNNFSEKPPEPRIEQVFEIAEEPEIEVNTEVNNDIDGDMIALDAKSVLDRISPDITEPLPTIASPTNNQPSLEILPDERALSIPFDIGSTDLQDNTKNLLLSGIVPSLQRNKDLRLEIRAYSSPNIEEQNARRTSLVRALEIRNFLEENGIDKERVNVRALGDQTEKLPTDRADLFILF